MTDNSREQHPAAPGAGWPVNGRVRLLLVVALAAVVGMAFRVSWNALRDVASAIGADSVAATLYPFVVDGLMALALVATLVLTDRDRRFALWVLGFYTVASLVLNYVHGLIPGLHDMAGDRVRLSPNDLVHWALVLLASSLPVGAIFFGSDLVARVLHHRPESAPTGAERSGAEQRESAPPAPAPVDPSEAVESTPGAGPVGPDPVEESAPTEPRPKRASMPRRSTGAVPDAARQSAPRRTLEELLTEARALPDADQQSAEQIRKTLRVGAPRAREIRDLLAAERAESTVPRALHAVHADDTRERTAAAGGVR